MKPKIVVKIPGSEFRIDGVRLSYPSLWEPVAYQANPGSQPKYNATVLIPKSSTDVINAIAEQVKIAADQNFGAKANSVLARMKQQPNYHIIKDGDLKADKDGYAGNVYLHASNTRAPLVLNIDRSPLTKDDGTLCAGDYVNIIVRLYASKNYGIICASFTGIQKRATGDRFTAGAANVDDFDDCSSEDDEAATGTSYF